MRILLLFVLAVILSCSSTWERTNFDTGNDCGRMKLWNDEYLTKSLLEKRDGITSIRGMTRNKKLRVIVIENPSGYAKIKVQRKMTARNNALQAAKRKLVELIRTEFHSSPHGAGMDGIQIFYRGKSYSGNGFIEFSNIVKTISESGKIICEDFDEADRCLIIYEADLRPLDG